MNPKTLHSSRFRRRMAFRVGLIVMLSLWSMSHGAAQTTTTTASDTMTPLAISPGGPAGSYELSGFENVNLYNGNLSFHLPLVHIGGRGSAGYTMMLSLNTKGWTVRHSQTQTSESWFPLRSGQDS